MTEWRALVKIPYEDTFAWIRDRRVPMIKRGRFIPRDIPQETFFSCYGDEQLKIVGDDFIYSVRVDDLFRVFRDRLVAERTFLGVEEQ